MRSSWSTRGAATAAIMAGVFLAHALAAAQPQAEIIAAANAAGWQIPSNADQERNPLTATPRLLSKGKDLFSSNCQKCHGPSGHGDGPNGDPQHPPADLTASTNSDAVMFYKVWNGRKSPAMPPFKSLLTREEIWTVIEYAKSLRPQSAD